MICSNPSCNHEVVVDDDYMAEYCCLGHGCGCLGLPINPVFCVECEEVLNCGGNL